MSEQLLQIIIWRYLMITNLKQKKHIRWGIIAIIALFCIVFLIILKNSPNNENILAESKYPSESGEEIQLNRLYSIPDEFCYESYKNTKVYVEKEEVTNPKKLINFKAKHPFLVRINRAENFAVIYGIDKKGRYSVPYKAFWCSTGRDPEDTPLGVFKMSERYRWRLMVDGSYAQYAIRINGEIMLHSIPYLDASSDTLETWEYNKLGKPASLGCIRFKAGVIKWIYDHCEEGTTVVVYNAPGEESPIELKKLEKIKKSSDKAGWDPTDPDEENPWKKEGKK